MKPLFLNRNLSRLMILIKLKERGKRMSWKMKTKTARGSQKKKTVLKKIQQEESKEKEKEMWKRLGEFN